MPNNCGVCNKRVDGKYYHINVVIQHEEVVNDLICEGCFEQGGAIEDLFGEVLVCVVGGNKTVAKILISSGLLIDRGIKTLKQRIRG